jgi:hypothetical protein
MHQSGKVFASHVAYNGTPFGDGRHCIWLVIHESRQTQNRARREFGPYEHVTTVILKSHHRFSLTQNKEPVRSLTLTKEYATLGTVQRDGVLQEPEEQSRLGNKRGGVKVHERIVRAFVVTGSDRDHIGQQPPIGEADAEPRPGGERRDVRSGATEGRGERSQESGVREQSERAQSRSFLCIVFYSGGVLTVHDGSGCWRLAVCREETNARALSADAKVIPAE